MMLTEPSLSSADFILKAKIIELIYFWGDIPWSLQVFFYSKSDTAYNFLQIPKSSI